MNEIITLPGDSGYKSRYFLYHKDEHNRYWILVGFSPFWQNHYKEQPIFQLIQGEPSRETLPLETYFFVSEEEATFYQNQNMFPLVSRETQGGIKFIIGTWNRGFSEDKNVDNRA